jgi:hypothetical protein
MSVTRADLNAAREGIQKTAAIDLSTFFSGGGDTAIKAKAQRDALRLKKTKEYWLQDMQRKLGLSPTEEEVNEYFKANAKAMMAEEIKAYKATAAKDAEGGMLTRQQATMGGLTAGLGGLIGAAFGGVPGAVIGTILGGLGTWAMEEFDLTPDWLEEFINSTSEKIFGKDSEDFNVEEMEKTKMAAKEEYLKGTKGGVKPTVYKDEDAKNDAIKVTGSENIPPLDDTIDETKLRGDVETPGKAKLIPGATTAKILPDKVTGAGTPVVTNPEGTRPMVEFQRQLHALVKSGKPITSQQMASIIEGVDMPYAQEMAVTRRIQSGEFGADAARAYRILTDTATEADRRAEQELLQKVTPTKPTSNIPPRPGTPTDTGKPVVTGSKPDDAKWTKGLNEANKTRRESGLPDITMDEFRKNVNNLETKGHPSPVETSTPKPAIQPSPETKNWLDKVQDSIRNTFTIPENPR